MAKFFLTSILGLMIAVPQVWARNVDLPRGTAIQVRLTDQISSEQNRKGDRFNAVLDQDIYENNNLLARKGDPVTGELLRVYNNDKDNGDLVEMTLRDLRSGNTSYRLDTNNVIVKNKEGGNGKDATMIGGGAGVGAVIGAIAGGVKGAIIGAAVGAGAGAAAILITNDKDVKFDPEQKFRFYLDRDVNMAVLSATDRNRNQSSSTSDDSPYLRSSDDQDRSSNSQDDDWRTSNSGSVNSSDRQSISRAVSELDQQADHLWSVVRGDSNFLSDSRNSSNTSRSRETEDRMALYIALSNFANSTEVFQTLIRDNRDVDYRGGAMAIVRQAEDIDRMLRNTNTFAHLQDDWSQVQNAVERLGNTFNIAYSPSGSSTYRAE